MSQARYGAYKGSGVEWLGEVPSEWRVAKVKSTCSHLRDGTHGSFERVDVGYPLLSVRNIVNSKFVLLTDDSCISEHDYKSISKSLIIKAGDLQLAIVGATLGKVALVPENMPKFVTQRSLSTLRPIAKILYNRFLFYFAGNSYFQDALWSKANYSAQPGVYLYTISNIDILLPPIVEQTAIAAYLDTQTAQIDRKIDLLSQKAMQYGKLKQSLINETVTRGLVKTVAMKDSGVEWIGDVPAHWEVKRLKEVFIESKSKSATGDETLLSVSEYTGITQTQDNVGEDEFLSNAVSLVGYKICKVGDLVINIMLAWKRGLGVSSFSGIVSPSYAVFRPLKKVNPLFFHYLLRSEDAIVEFKRNSTGIIESRLRLYSDSFYALSVAVPPFEEQQAIAAYLDEKTTHIDRIVATINAQIDKLKELRKTLINDIVTGKICIFKQEASHE